jgi:hypothetical protein
VLELRIVQALLWGQFGSTHCIDDLKVGKV